MKWTWRWTPGFSAEFGDNLVFDWVRVVCVILGMLMLMAIGRILVEAKRRGDYMPPTQWARFASLALAGISISLTEIAVVGTPATPRLIVNIATIGLGLYGVWGMRRKQKKRPPKQRQKGTP